MPASGFGFLWPIVCFDSDGASIGVHGYSNLDSREPVRFLTNFHEVVRASTFELTAGDFVNTVLARLAACGVTGTPLEQLWHEVAQERRDPQSTRFRKLEALLGCDPDTANEDTLHALGKLAETAGAAAVDEIANPRFVVTNLSAEQFPMRGCTRNCIAGAGRWRTASRNSNWGCLPTAPRPN